MLVNSIYKSIQGEGIDQGKPTVFVRFSGCNLKCSYCDSTYHVEGDKKSIMSVEEIIKSFNCENVYLTGGEPLLQEDLFDLIHLLLIDDLNVRIATNGTMSVPNWAGSVWWDIDYKCPSAVNNDLFNLEWLKYTNKNDGLKFVVLDDEDLSFVDFILKSENIKESKISIFVSPALPNNINFIQKLWNFAIEHNIRFSYQIHKLLFGDIKNI